MNTDQFPPATITLRFAAYFSLTLVARAGAAGRNFIGLVLVGGMTIGTLFTLFVVLSINMLVAFDHSRKQDSASWLITGFNSMVFHQVGRSGAPPRMVPSFRNRAPFRG